MTSPNIIAVMPAYNEEKTIGDQIKSLIPHVAKIIVVDDRSDDATAEIALRAGAEVIRHAENKGYDASLNDGFALAASQGADIIFTFDADGEHDAADIQKIVTPIIRGEADIVAGQRPETRHWGEDIFAFVTRRRFGIPDPLCGFKAYRRSVYDSVGFFDSVRSIGTELMIRGIRRGFRLKLVPIALHSRIDGSSRFYALNLRGNLRMIRAMFKILSV